jgi:hypothetical protein
MNTLDTTEIETEISQSLFYEKFPDVDNTDHYLNEHGKLVWKHKTNKRLFLERAYHWVDSIIMIDETEGRNVVQSFKYSTYDFRGWNTMSKEEYDSVKSNYNEKI